MNLGTIIISKIPGVEAKESLGFLPDDLEDKVYTYLRSVYDTIFIFLVGEVSKIHGKRYDRSRVTGLHINKDK